MFGNWPFMYSVKTLCHSCSINSFGYYRNCFYVSVKINPPVCTSSLIKMTFFSIKIYSCLPCMNFQFYYFTKKSSKFSILMKNNNFLHCFQWRKLLFLLDWILTLRRPVGLNMGRKTCIQSFLGLYGSYKIVAFLL